MKVKVLFIFVVTYFVLLQISCDLPSGSSGNDETGIAKAYWGEWLVVKSSSSSTSENYYVDDKVSINKNKIEFVNRSRIIPPEEVNLDKRDDICPGMIQLKYSSFDTEQDAYEYFLLPIKAEKADSSTVSFTGRVARLNSSSQSVMGRAISGMGGIDAIIDNLSDAASPPVVVTTDTEGEFTMEEATPGDEYEVSVEDETTTFTPIAEGDDMGTITIASGGSVNFKTSRNSDNVYNADRLFYIELSIENIGSTTAQGATYTITTEDGLILNSSGYGVLGTISPGEKKSLTVTIKCNSFSGDSLIWKKIFIEINDPINKKTWNDSVSVPFYPSTPLPEMRTTINFSGRGFLTVIAPNGEVVNTGYDRVIIPKMPGEYTLIVTNNGSNEGMYAIAMGDAKTYPNLPITDDYTYTEFPYIPTTPTGDEIAKYKPNHTAADAPKVTLPIVAYSLRNHMDFYKISLE